MLEMRPLVLIFFENNQVFPTKIIKDSSIGSAGRFAKANIQFTSPFLKRIHGEFIADGNRWIYVNRSRLKTTWINNQYLDPGSGVEVLENSVIRIFDESDNTKQLVIYVTFRLERAHIPWQPVDRSVLYQQPPRTDYIMIDAGTSVWAQPTPELAPPQFRQQLQHRIQQEAGVLNINLKDVTVSKGLRKYTLLKNVNTEIRTKDVVLVLGSSGAGKSTFLNAVSGYEPANAEVSFEGLDLSSNPELFRKLARHVPQYDHLRPRDTVVDTLRDALNLNSTAAGLSKDLREARTFEVLRLFDLEAHAKNSVSSLSGGQRKRLSIAVEYIANPHIFFLDEPDSGLDFKHSVELMQKLREIADQGKIVLVISHNADQVSQFIDKVLVLGRDSREKCGTEVFFGTKEDAFKFFGVNSFSEIVQALETKNSSGETCADPHIDRYRAYKEGK